MILWRTKLISFVIARARFWQKYRRALIVALLCFTSTACKSEEKKDQIPLAQAPVTHLRSTSELQWGLMGIKKLDPERVFLFHLDHTRYARVWMFNVFVDLSAAFIDKNGVITEIHHLKSYPEKMDPKRPIKKWDDFQLYPLNDPIITFFHNESIASKNKVDFILETPPNWFQENNIKTGDFIKLNKNKNLLYFYSNH
ncbi:MAG: hypothetical protein CMO81_11095 [Waddliaceae bacterium]|nr:hypothetical protein [Waddliaceae bacterium]